VLFLLHAALFTSASAALQGDEPVETLDSLGQLSLAKRGFQIVRVPMPSDLEAGSSLPDDAVPVKIPQGNGDPLIDAIEFYGDVNQNSVAEVQVGVHWSVLCFVSSTYCTVACCLKYILSVWSAGECQCSVQSAARSGLTQWQRCRWA
jgi:hypothetical protein